MSGSPTPAPTQPAPAQLADTFDSRAFRVALGGFATGVCIVTAVAEDGRRVGMTINSFSSVSLDPPLVLWSIARTAQSLPVFSTVKHWAVNVLAEDQESLSNTFARPPLSAEGHRYDGVATSEGIGGAPLIEGAIARFQCATEHLYDGGDHVIVVGRVLAFDRVESAPPLLFAQGRYGRLAR